MRSTLNVVVATSLSTVTVNGDGNVVTWESGNPRTQQSGVLNVLTGSC